jgi:hypothetical protein
MDSKGLAGRDNPAGHVVQWFGETTTRVHGGPGTKQAGTQIPQNPFESQEPSRAEALGRFT